METVGAIIYFIFLPLFAGLISFLAQVLFFAFLMWLIRSWIKDIVNENKPPEPTYPTYTYEEQQELLKYVPDKDAPVGAFDEPQTWTERFI